MADTIPIQISFSDKPRAVLASMYDLLAKKDHNNDIFQRWRRFPLLLFLLGLPLPLVDLFLKLVFGYNAILFTLVGGVFWVTALVLTIALHRTKVKDFPPHYHTGRLIILTLRDDVAPKRDLFGHLDLTGAQQESKLASETPNALGLTVQRYRDEWLMLKAKLYDGNMLRMSTIERVKVRKGYWKRGSISGKMKWKEPVVKEDRQQLQVRLSVTPRFTK